MITADNATLVSKSGRDSANREPAETMAASGLSPVIAAIIPCRNHARELDACLDSLDRQRIRVPHEIIVVDSASSPEVAAVAQRHPKVRLVRSATPLLAGPARNLGAASTTAPYLAFIDADCVAEPDWLAKAHMALAAGADGCGGPVADQLPDRLVAVADNMLQFYDQSVGRPAGPVPYLPSCNLAIRREAFEALDGFKNISPGHDVMLTTAIAKRRPQSLRFEPSMRVRHRGREDLRTFWHHHQAFGRARGAYALLGQTYEQRLARHYFWIGPLVIKRLAFMTFRTARWNPARLPKFLMLSPLLAVGITSWAWGLVDGTRRRASADGDQARQPYSSLTAATHPADNWPQPEPKR